LKALQLLGRPVNRLEDTGPRRLPRHRRTSRQRETSSRGRTERRQGATAGLPRRTVRLSSLSQRPHRVAGGLLGSLETSNKTCDVGKKANTHGAISHRFTPYAKAFRGSL